MLRGLWWGTAAARTRAPVVANAASASVQGTASTPSPHSSRQNHFTKHRIAPTRSNQPASLTSDSQVSVTLAQADQPARTPKHLWNFSPSQQCFQWPIGRPAATHTHLHPHTRSAMTHARPPAPPAHMSTPAGRQPRETRQESCTQPPTPAP